MEYPVRKVVMTGGTSGIGLALIRKLLDEGIEILMLRRNITSRVMELPEHELLHVDYCALEELKDYVPKKADYDVFFHLGWAKTSQEERKDILLQMKNVEYSCEAVKLAHRCGCHTFIGAGSQAEYGRHDEALREDTVCTPENAYGAMKLCCCHSTRILCKDLGIRYIWPRILSAYGIYDGMGTMLMSAVIKGLERKKLEFTAGEQIWDFLYFDDLANALYLLAKKGTDGEIYPVSSGRPRPLKNFIHILCEKLGCLENMELGKIPYGKSQIMHLEADISKLQKDTGWEPRVEFEDGIERVIEFYREQQFG